MRAGFFFVDKIENRMPLSLRLALGDYFFFCCPGAYGLADFEPVAFFCCPGGTLPLGFDFPGLVTISVVQDVARLIVTVTSIYTMVFIIFMFS